MKAAAILLAFALPTAVVERGAAQVTVVRNLAFGTVLTGVTSSISKTSANAAEWKIHGTIGIGGGFQLTLPSSLSGAGTTLPITFSSTDGVYRLNSNNPVGGTTFNPHNFVSLLVVSRSDVYVWLGASVSPPLNQPPGAYTGTVVLTTAGLL